MLKQSFSKAKKVLTILLAVLFEHHNRFAAGASLRLPSLWWLKRPATSALDSDLSRKVVHQSKIIRELQELSMVMRMVPIQGVFQKMARIIRDLSHKTGKQIDFVTRGEETELDRNIVDKITDPLVHMIRNSVDHGIELPEERAKAGKKPARQS